MRAGKATERGMRLHPVALPENPPSAVRVSDVLALPGFAGSRVIAGRGGLHSQIEHVNVIQIPTDRFVKPDELVLTAASTFRDYGGDVTALFVALKNRGISALAVRGRVRRLLGQALSVAEESDLPLIELPTTTHLSELQTQVLETIVHARTQQLKQAESIRDQLAEHVLRGGGLEAVLEGVAGVVGGDVVLVRREGQVLASTVGAETEHAVRVAEACLENKDSLPGRTDGGWIAWPVMAAGRRLGCLVAKVAGEYDVMIHAALQHGATDAALQILHHDEALEAHARVKAGFVRDLLNGSVFSVSALRRAEAVGWDPSGSFRALVIGVTRADRGRVLRALRETAPRALVAERGDECLVIAPEGHRSGPSQGDDGSGGVAEWATRTFPAVHVGMSAVHSGLGELPAAVAEAREALRTSRVFDRRVRTRRFEELGVLRFLSAVPPEELRAFELSVLRPLDELDRAYRESLLHTLEVLIESDLNVAETARREGCHYNTVRNRVARLTDMLGPVTKAGTLLDAVRLALVIRQDLGADPPVDRERPRRASGPRLQPATGIPVTEPPLPRQVETGSAGAASSSSSLA
jgi:purine catabolism regulator